MKTLKHLLAATIAVFMLAGCDGGTVSSISSVEPTPSSSEPESISSSEEHTHTFAEVWSHDDTHHWHQATCGHDVKDGYAEHSFGDWKTTKEASETEKGSKERTCSVCEYVQVEEIPMIEHVHTFEESWTYDENTHWHKATCGHEVKGEEEAHTLSEWAVETAATAVEDGVEERHCTVCGYKKTRPIWHHEYVIDYGFKTNEVFTVTEEEDGQRFVAAAMNDESKGYDGYYLSLSGKKVDLASAYTFVFRNNDDAREELRIGYRDTTVSPKTFANSEDASAYTIESLNNRSNTKIREVKSGYIKFNIEAGDTAKITVPIVSQAYDQLVLMLVHSTMDTDITLIQTGYVLGQHNFEEGWHHDDTHHWKACLDEDCGFVSQKGAHDWIANELKTDVPATATEDGVEYKICSVCGLEKEVVIPAGGQTNTLEFYGAWSINFGTLTTNADGSTKFVYTQTDANKYNPLQVTNFLDQVGDRIAEVKSITFEIKNNKDREFHSCLAIKDDSAIITSAGSADDATGGVTWKRHSNGSGEYFNVAANGSGTITGHIAEGKVITKVRLLVDYDQFEMEGEIELGKITVNF